MHKNLTRLPTSFRVWEWVNSNWTFCPESVIGEFGTIFKLERFGWIYCGKLPPNCGQ